MVVASRDIRYQVSNEIIATPSLLWDPPVPVKSTAFASATSMTNHDGDWTTSREELDDVEEVIPYTPRNVLTDEEFLQQNERIRRSSTSSASKSSSGSTKSVSFSNVHVREHCVIIGDNPCCEILPLSLGWSHIDEKIYDVDDYEHKKQQQRSGPSHQRPKLDHANRLTFVERMNMLKRVSGMNESDIMCLEWNRRSNDNFEY